MADPPATPTSFKEALKPLTAKQRAFVLAYLHDPKARFNQTRAALTAGYSEKAAYQQGYMNMRNREVRRAIDLGFEEAGMSPAVALAKVEEIAHASLEDFLSIKTVKHRPPITMPLWEAKIYLETEIEGFDHRLAAAMTRGDKALERELRNDQTRFKRYLTHYESPRQDGRPRDQHELVEVPGEVVEEEVAYVDIPRAIRAGKGHLLSEFTAEKDGRVKVKLWPVPDALRTVLERHGYLKKRLDVTSGDKPVKFIQGASEEDI